MQRRCRGWMFAGGGILDLSMLCAFPTLMPCVPHVSARACEKQPTEEAPLSPRYILSYVPLSLFMCWALYPFVNWDSLYAVLNGGNLVPFRFEYYPSCAARTTLLLLGFIHWCDKTKRWLCNLHNFDIGKDADLVAVDFGSRRAATRFQLCVIGSTRTSCQR